MQAYPIDQLLLSPESPNTCDVLLDLERTTLRDLELLNTLDVDVDWSTASDVHGQRIPDVMSRSCHTPYAQPRRYGSAQQFGTTEGFEDAVANARTSSYSDVPPLTASALVS